MAAQAVVGDVVLDEIQGLVRTGFKALTSARYLLFAVDDLQAARRWLGGLSVTSAGHRPADERPTRAVNIAFTYAGLKKLQLDQRALGDLSEELREGMITEHRKRILGDHGASDPKSWLWGGPGMAEIHGALLLFAADADELEALTGEARVADGITWLEPALDTSWLPGRKEQFGFHDGIAQPNLLGVHTEQPGFDVVAPGEVLLGYPNQYGKLPRAPRIDGRSELLPRGDDFGRGGSYLVFRQLEQKVADLWSWARETAERLHVGDLFPAAADPGICVAAKMVGRWPNGAPLVRWPTPRPTPAIPTCSPTTRSATPPMIRTAWPVRWARTFAAPTRATGSSPTTPAKRSRSPTTIAFSAAVVPTVRRWWPTWTPRCCRVQPTTGSRGG